MEIKERCQEIRAVVEAELAPLSGAEERTRALVQGVYRLSSVLAEMGSPGRSERYLEGREEALDLIVWLALPLVRGGHAGGEVVSVLVEVAEGCADPVLQQKLLAYAEQLRVRDLTRPTAAPVRRRHLAPLWWALAALLPLLLVELVTLPREEQRAEPVSQEAAAPVRPAPYHDGSKGSVRGAPLPTAREVAAPSAEGGKGALHSVAEKREELVTRVRVVANQVLVPVTVRNGGEPLQVILLLDTGATRTALRDSLAPRLGVDLEAAKGALVQVADGRVLHAKLAQVEELTVGPHRALTPELEFYPYSGEDGLDGLLGMDFLGRFHYQLDLENEVIRWVAR